VTAVSINLRELEEKFSAGEEISYESLVTRKIIKASAGYVKILGSGEITKAFTIKDLDISAVAAEKITAAGGKVLSVMDETNG